MRRIQARQKPILASPLASLLKLFFDAPTKRGIDLPVSVVSFRQRLDAPDIVHQEEAFARLEQAVSKTNISDLPSFAMRTDVPSLTCFEIEDERKYPSEMCVHDTSGTIARTFRRQG
jgi:hypothetical protein